MNLLAEVLKRLVSKPVTGKYPKEKPEIPEGFRGKTMWNRETCTFCCLCAINCPTGAIIVNREKKIWSIDIGKCIFCGKCHDVCPTEPKSVFQTKSYELATSEKKDLEMSFVR